MKYFNKIMCVSLIFICLMLSACDIALQKPKDITLDELLLETPRQNTNADRFHNTTDSPTAVDSTLKLSQDLETLTEKLASQEKLNKQLSDENHLIKQQKKLLEDELEQTKKELDQTNKLLMDLRVELDEWKASTLEFQKEIRNTDKAQLEALYKILQILDGKNEQ